MTPNSCGYGLPFSLEARELIYLPVMLADPAGEISVSSSAKVRIKIEGPAELIGFGTDDPLPTENFYDSERTTYDGRALAVLRPFAKGTVTVKLSAADLGEVDVVIAVL